MTPRAAAGPGLSPFRRRLTESSWFRQNGGVTEESQAPQDVKDASPHPFVARLREFGPAGWFFVVFLVVAIAAVAISLTGDEEAAPSTTEVAATEATEATTTTTLAVASTATTVGTGDGSALRAALDSLQACLEEDETLPLRVLGAAGDRIEVGTRNQDRVEELAAAFAESTCLAAFQEEFPDAIVVVVGPEDRGDGASPTTVAPTTIPDTTDGSSVPTAPSTDNTLP